MALPSGVITSIWPDRALGAMAVIWVFESTVKVDCTPEEQLEEPAQNVTEVALSKFSPVMTTLEPT